MVKFNFSKEILYLKQKNLGGPKAQNLVIFVFYGLENEKDENKDVKEILENQKRYLLGQFSEQNMISKLFS